LLRSKLIPSHYYDQFKNKRRLQELENVQNRAVTGTVTVENSGGGDHGQTAASSPFGRKAIRLLILGLPIVGVVVGVVVVLGGKDGDPPTMAPTVTVSKTLVPTASPTIFIIHQPKVYTIIVKSHWRGHVGYQVLAKPYHASICGTGFHNPAISHQISLHTPAQPKLTSWSNYHVITPLKSPVLAARVAVLLTEKLANNQQP
jgi:hypothetical protein